MLIVDICLLSFGYRASGTVPERAFSLKNRYRICSAAGVVVLLLL